MLLHLLLCYLLNLLLRLLQLLLSLLPLPTLATLSPMRFEQSIFVSVKPLFTWTL